MKTLQGFSIGDRVQLHPGTDRWMRGDKYGAVIGVGRKYLTVSMDRTSDVIKVSPDNLTFM